MKLLIRLQQVAFAILLLEGICIYSILSATNCNAHPMANAKVAVAPARKPTMSATHVVTIDIGRKITKNASEFAACQAIPHCLVFPTKQQVADARIK